MAATKTEIIEALYKAGKITFQEAMILSAQESKSVEPTMYEGAQQGQENLRAIERQKAEIIEAYLDEITDQYFDDKEDPKHENNLAFDIDKCVEAMYNCDWQWITGKVADDGSPQTEEVTHELFRKELREHIRTVIYGVIERRIRNSEKDRADAYEYCTGTGGIEVTGWVEEDNDGEHLIIHPRFVLEHTEAELDPGKFIMLLQ